MKKNKMLEFLKKDLLLNLVLVVLVGRVPARVFD